MLSAILIVLAATALLVVAGVVGYGVHVARQSALRPRVRVLVSTSHGYAVRGVHWATTPGYLELVDATVQGAGDERPVQADGNRFLIPRDSVIWIQVVE